MGYLNKIILMGNLTRDPQKTVLTSNVEVSDFGIAVNRRYKTQSGEVKEDVCFVDCRTFGKLATTINNHFKKGRTICVEGRLAYDSWEAKDGSKHSKHRVVVENFTFVDYEEKKDAVVVASDASVQAEYDGLTF